MLLDVAEEELACEVYDEGVVASVIPEVSWNVFHSAKSFIRLTTKTILITLIQPSMLFLVVLE